MVNQAFLVHCRRFLALKQCTEFEAEVLHKNSVNRSYYVDDCLYRHGTASEPDNQLFWRATVFTFSTRVKRSSESCDRPIYFQAVCLQSFSQAKLPSIDVKTWWRKFNPVDTGKIDIPSVKIQQRKNQWQKMIVVSIFHSLTFTKTQNWVVWTVVYWCFVF